MLIQSNTFHLILNFVINYQVEMIDDWGVYRSTAKIILDLT